MKFRHKLLKLTRRNTYARALVRCRAALHPLPLAPLLKPVNHEKLAQLTDLYGGRPHPYPSKYLDVTRWMKWNILRVQRLGLHRSSPKRILDLGCGAGYFAYICQTLGHTCVGLDTGDYELYSEMCALLGVQRVLHRIEPFEPLPPLGEKFDWITAFSISFNGHRTHAVWGPKEWQFLINDLRQRTVGSGHLFFALNPEPGDRFYTPELEAFFRREGGIIDKEYILLPARVPQQSAA